MRSFDTQHQVPDGKCSHPGCPNTFRDHHWGHKKAQREGWFFQKSGDQWCPEHVPEWVEEWRARRT